MNISVGNSSPKIFCSESWNNGKKEIAIAKQQRSKHIPTTINKYAITEELLEAVFSIQSMTRLYS
jgi:hypothetical protein